MQGLKFEDNKIIPHRYNALLFALLTGLTFAFLCPSLPSSGHVALQSDYSSPVMSSLNFIQALWVNGRLGHWSERKAEDSSIRHAQ